ncbi:DUF6884 domain-containing protein [Streptomyces sp. 7N604]|uniref:DUF6884 domain-containing protein n=1 Tax=Streptomyces sp. 7N604 TaxID=3457415 RepID=UPI003FD0C956
MRAPTLRPRVVIVACGGRKSTSKQPIPAGQMYTGSYHLALRRAADALTHGGRTGRVFILSALHGLLALEDPITPYDLRMGDEGSVTSGQLRQQAIDLGVIGAEATVLGPRAYVEASRTVWPDLTAPLEGSRGIGEQLGRLADIYRPSHTAQVPPSPAHRPSSTPNLIDELERSAAARQNAEDAKAANKRARYAKCSRVLILRPCRAQGSVEFPGSPAEATARARAAERFASLYGVQVHAAPGAARTLDVRGTPRNVSRFLSALPRVLDKAETRATEAARLYGRWERHSAARRHLAGVPQSQRRLLARDFRSAAFDVVIDMLLAPPNSVAEAEVGLAPWEQVHRLAAGIAHYYWFDPADEADPNETARILAAADRRHLTEPATAPATSGASADHARATRRCRRRSLAPLDAA